MRVKLWGVRGSLPSPATPEFQRWRIEEILTQYERMRDASIPITARGFIETLPPHTAGGYGGNTSCCEIVQGKDRILIDCGSGLRAFSDYIMKSDATINEFHIYMTHFHWDHLIGLPFFVPMYVKGKTIHFYSVEDSMEESLRTLFKKPNFPVPYEALGAQILTHRVKPYKPFRVGEIAITPYKLDHPDPCWGARVEANGKALAWAVDTECTRVSRTDLGPDQALYSAADLLVFDAQYTLAEANEKSNWGHSSGSMGVDLALREKVKEIVFIHHDPSATDEMIHHAEEQTQNYYEELLRSLRRQGKEPASLKWRFGREGDEFEL